MFLDFICRSRLAADKPSFKDKRIRDFVMARKEDLKLFYLSP